jgi:hypothetical protein
MGAGKTADLRLGVNFQPGSNVKMSSLVVWASGRENSATLEMIFTKGDSSLLNGVLARFEAFIVIVQKAFEAFRA